MRQLFWFIFFVFLKFSVTYAKRSDKIINFLNATCDLIDKRNVSVDLCHANPEGNLDVIFKLSSPADIFVR